jgi:hypothetical protein
MLSLEQDRQEMFNWLSEIQYKTHHKTMGKGVLPGSGKWLLEKQALSTEKKIALPPSCGFMESVRHAMFFAKRILAKSLHSRFRQEQTYVSSSIGPYLIRAFTDFCSHTVIGHLSEETSTIASAIAVPTAFFYCTRNASDSARADPDEIMRCILKQLSCTKSDLPVREPIAPLYRNMKEEANDHGLKEPPKLTIEESTELILDLLQNNRATIILDALDECDPERRYELLLAFDKIIRDSSNVVKVFVSSRDDQDMVCRLENSPSVFIRASDNREDINRFVTSQVEQAIAEKRLLNGNVTGALKNKIVQVLIDGAHGM